MPSRRGAPCVGCQVACPASAHPLRCKGQVACRQADFPALLLAQSMPCRESCRPENSAIIMQGRSKLSGDGMPLRALQRAHHACIAALPVSQRTTLYSVAGAPLNCNLRSPRLQMLEFGMEHPGTYMKSKQEGLKDHGKHYPSSNTNDEMAWGALWLYFATGVGPCSSCTQSPWFLTQLCTTAP